MQGLVHATRLESNLDGPRSHRAAHVDVPHRLIATQTFNGFVERRDLRWQSRCRMAYRHLYDENSDDSNPRCHPPFGAPDGDDGIEETLPHETS